MRKFSRDWVIQSDCAALQHNGHDASPRPSCAWKKRRSHQAWPKSVKLFARCPETGQFDDGMLAEVESGAEGKIEERESSRGDVLAEIACLKRRYGLAAGDIGFSSQRIEKLSREEMDLRSIGRGRVTANQVAMANRRSAVRVTLYTKTSEQMDGELPVFGEGVFRIEADSNDSAGGHGV